MGLIADYYNELAALLPSGAAWDVESPSVLIKFLDAWSQEFGRAQAHIDSLVDEVDPRSTFGLLPDYERIFDLPTTCMYGIAQTLQQRHNALVSQMTSAGGQSRAYFIALAAAAGFAITITEFTPFNVGMTIDNSIFGEDWRFAWQINAPPVTATSFLMTSGVDEALATWGNTLLECVINRFKPAHTIVIFSYS